MYYDIIKALHILSVISWMVGLLYLPRLFVYHADAEIGTVRAETFKVMERRLLKAIMTPAMIASFIFGVWIIALNHGLVFETWFQIKVVLMILLSVYNDYLGKCLAALKNSTNTKSAKFFRIINEIPTVILIIVVFLAIFKPI